MTHRAGSRRPAGRVPRGVRGEGSSPGAVGTGGFLAFLASALAAILIVAAGVLYVAVEMTLTPARWLDALESSGAYDRAPAAIAEQIIAWMDSRPADQPRSLGPLDSSDVQEIVATLAPPDWLRSEAAAVVPAVVDGVTATGQVQAVVSLDTLKAQLTGPTLLGVVLDRIATWPACTDAQTPLLASPQPPRCRPASATSGELAVVVAGLFSVVAAELPASVDLATPGEAPGSGVLATAGISDVLRLAGFAHSSLPLVVAAALVLLLLGAPAGGGGWRGVARHLGAPALVGGLLLLVPALGVDAQLGAAVGEIRQTLADGGMAPGMVSIVGSAALVMVDRAGWLFLQVAAPVAAAGAALLAAAWLVPARRSVSPAR